MNNCPPDNRGPYFHLEFFPAEHALFDEHFIGRRSVDAALDDLDELAFVIGDAATGAAHREGGPDDGGQPDVVKRRVRAIDKVFT